MGVLNRLGPLVEPNFRRLWIGRTTSAVGDALSGVALVFAVLGISDSAADLGFVIAAFMVPRVAFLLVGGVWADRVPRRLLMVGADVTSLHAGGLQADHDRRSGHAHEAACRRCLDLG